MSGFFSPATLEQIRSASDIVDVIGSYVPLKRAGANFVALCPFHKEKSPSFNVNPHKQIFYCFGCHKGGDIFSFVKEFENIPFPDAVRRLAERAKIPLEMEKGGDSQLTRHVKDSLLHIHEQIAQRWQNALSNDAAGQIARDYLAKRGVSDEAVKLFRLGYAPDLWDDTVNWAKSKGHDVALVEQGGLILRREGGDGHYDRFRGRLMFPICDEQGRVIGFSGRVLSGDQKTAKYVNSPETPIFTKGRVFFGLDKSKRALLDEQSAIVCEGQLDLIACYMAGAQNIVAPQGTALTADHARILKRYVEEVVLCFDSDAAGQNAAVRSLDSLLASGLAIRVAVVPAPHDPDSFIKESGGAAFKQLIEEAEGFFDYYLNRLCETNDTATDKGRLTVLHDMAEAVHKTGNLVLVDTYAQKTALRLGVAPEAVRAEFKKAARAKKSYPISGGETQEATELEAAPDAGSEMSQPSVHEFSFVRLLLESEDEVAWVAAHFDLNWISNLQVRELVGRRFDLQKQGGWQGVPQFITNVESEPVRNLIAGALTRPVISNIDGTKMPRNKTFQNASDQIRDVMVALRNDFVKRQVFLVRARLAQAGISDEESHDLVRRLEQLRKLKSTPLASTEGGGESPST